MVRKMPRVWRKKGPSEQESPAVSAPKTDTQVVKGAISGRLEDNLKALREQFQDCSDVVFRELLVDKNIKALLVFIDGLVASQDLHTNALKPLLFQYTDHVPDLISSLEDRGVAVSQISHVDNYAKSIDALLSGNSLLFVEGQKKALAINVGGGQRRSVSEPVSEAVVRGPREGFTESLRTNTGLLRHKVRSPNLKTISYTIGEETRTEVVVAYLDGLADPKVIDEVKRRLKSIKIDGVLESAYIEEMIEDAPYSPFPQFQYTERPDTVAAQLLEGRFAIFVDGTPFVLIAPITFWQMMQASEDYYERFFISTLLRWLRFVFVALALYLPALYIAVTTYHQDMLPTSLLLSI
ncbi:MAG: spore germination protein, partial [Tumebacillaceae bacterium]